MKYYKNKKLEEITKKIVAMMPSMEPFFLGEENIENYSQKINQYDALPVHEERQKFFIGIIRKKIGRLFSTEERKNIRVLEDNKGLSGGVTDHHGILNHPVLFGANIITDYYRMFDRKNNGDILTFATANVPVNDFFHRRGFMINNTKFNLFDKADKNKVIYNLDKHKFDFIDRLAKQKKPELQTKKIQEVLSEVEELIGTIDFSGCQSYDDQIIKVNFYLWPLMFDKKIRSRVSNLICLSYDDMVIDYLIHVLKNEQTSFIYQMLFNDDFRQEVLAHFEGRTGAWNKKRGTGTHFFWGLSKNHEHLRLGLIDNKLSCPADNFFIEWSPESIIKALQDKQILPGMLLKFSLLLYYMGLKPYTGYGSAYYLYVLQQDMVEFLKSKHPEEAKNMTGIPMNTVTTIPVVLFRGKNGQVANYYAFDIIKDGGLKSDYFQKINSIPVKNFMIPNLNTIYTYAFNLYGHGEPQDFAITAEDYADIFKGVV